MQKKRKKNITYSILLSFFKYIPYPKISPFLNSPKKIFPKWSRCWPKPSNTFSSH